MGLATLIVPIFPNYFFDNPDSSLFDACLNGHCAVFVKLSFFCKKLDGFESTYKVFFSYKTKNACQVIFAI